MGIVKNLKTDFQRGREAAEAGVEPHELYRLPDLTTLTAYFTERYADPELGYLLAVALKNCPVWDHQVVVTAIRNLPAAAVHALYLAFCSESSDTAA